MDHEVKRSRPSGQHGETPSLLKIQKISWARWRMLVIPVTWDYRRAPPRRANFLYLIKMGFHHGSQVALKLRTSGNPLSLASRSAGITGVSHFAQPGLFTFNFSDEAAGEESGTGRTQKGKPEPWAVYSEG